MKPHPCTSLSARGAAFSAEFGSCYGSTRPPPAQVGVRGSALGLGGGGRAEGRAAAALGVLCEPSSGLSLPAHTAALPLERSSDRQRPGAAGEGVTPLRRWVLAKGPRCRAVPWCWLTARAELSRASSGSGENQAGCAVPGRVLPGTVSSRFSAALPSLLFIKLGCKTGKSSYTALL